MADEETQAPAPKAPSPLEIIGPPNRSIQDERFGLRFRIPWDGTHQVWADFSVDGVRIDYRDGQWHDAGVPTYFTFVSLNPGHGQIKTWWRLRNDFSPANETSIWISNRPVIQSPGSDEFIYDDQMPLISGVGGGNCSLRILRADTNEVLSPTFTATANSWSVRLNRPLGFGQCSIKVEQSRPGFTTRYSQSVFFNVTGALITYPAPHRLVSSDELVFRGTAHSEWNIGVVKASNHYEAVSNPVSTNSRNEWEAPGKLMPSGTLIVEAQYSLPGFRHGYSPPLTVRVLGRPTITTPPSTVDTTFTIRGGNGLHGALVEILNDFNTTKVGQAGVFDPPGWSGSITVDPGLVTLVARQGTEGVFSSRGNTVIFKVRPPRLSSVTVAPLANAGLRFSGTGYKGATVDVYKVSGPGSQTLPSATVSSAGTWSVDSANWPPGQYSFRATQKVSDKSGGWIFSTEYTFDYVVVLPPPTVSYTGDYTPVFSGGGYTGATVELYNPGGGSKVAPDARVSGGSWSSTASEVWGPTWKRMVHLRQTLDGQTSEGWVALEVSIGPLAPVITEISTIEDGQQSPTFKGTCWAGALVTLWFSDSAQTHQATVNGDQWTFRRDTPFAVDITHHVTAIQRAAGQDSPEDRRAFSLERFLPQPLFTAPAPGEEVGRNLLVKGKGGIAGGQIEIHDAQFGGLVGTSASLVVDGDWEAQLDGLAFRAYTVTAVQVMGERQSEPSAELTFRVVVLPPVIEVPAPDGTQPRIGTVSGTGLPGAMVTVWLLGVEAPLFADVRVQNDGRWERRDVTLEIGRHSLRARQTFAGRESQDSLAQAFRVVPLAPTIESPVIAAPVGRQVVVSGFGYPADTVAVALGSAPQTVLGRAPVLADRTWSVAVELVGSAGNHDLIATASSGEFHSSPSLPRPVRLGPYVPSIEVPAPGRWVTDPVVFAGQGQPGVGELVSWFNPERQLVQDIVVTANGWRSQSTLRLPQGGYWVRFRQVIGTGGDSIQSDWADSRRFEVVPALPGITRTATEADGR
ncbi:hypothetical protein RG836_24500 [Pseudomonas sp. SZMC_28357]|uniref:hypothetical protein n=1 Tax=Pseudomonas sp. SZMC_28357 TaxID=3074380 RepID=UPI0028726B97|nr:hypothetical protein [Pseudomonas sp. SZMC_28357]MDR9754608.1 hypothetical protein [Pseudomonas sp. SZMC_28357]